MEAQLLRSADRGSLPPVGRDRPYHEIIPPAIRYPTVIGTTLPTMPDEAPESFGLKLASDEGEHVKSGEPLDRNLERDHRRTFCGRGLASQSVTPCDSLPLKGCRAKTPAKVPFRPRVPEINASEHRGCMPLQGAVIERDPFAVPRRWRKRERPRPLRQRVPMKRRDARLRSRQGPVKIFRGCGCAGPGCRAGRRPGS